MKKSLVLLALVLSTLGCSKDAGQHAGSKAPASSERDGVTDPRKVNDAGEKENAPKSDAPTPKKEHASTPQMIQFDPTDMAERSQEQLDAKYKDKAVALTGSVKRIERDKEKDTNFYNVQIQYLGTTGEKAVTYSRLYFSDDVPTLREQIEQGRSVTVSVEGNCLAVFSDKKGGGVIVLKDCKMAQPNKSGTVDSRDARPKTDARPKIIEDKTWAWGGSKDNYANLGRVDVHRINSWYVKSYIDELEPSQMDASCWQHCSCGEERQHGLGYFPSVFLKATGNRIIYPVSERFLKNAAIVEIGFRRP